MLMDQIHRQKKQHTLTSLPREAKIAHKQSKYITVSTVQH